MIHREVNLFWIALGFFTRIPMPASVEFSQAQLNRAIRYFPLVGWLIGGLSALAYLGLSLLFPPALAIALTMVVGLLLTGCFHEDGLADTCDGLGGGWTIEQKLTIMKDWRLGTYGAAGLWAALTLKFAALFSLAEATPGWIPALALLLAHPLSRVIPVVLIQVLPYVAAAETSKSKPLAESSSMRDAVIALWLAAPAVALLFCLELSSGVSGTQLALTVSLVLLAWGMVAMIGSRRQLGGITGDVLGAVQQIGELLVYFVWVSLVTVAANEVGVG